MQVVKAEKLKRTYVEVLSVNVVVLALEVLLCNENTLAEEVLVDLLALGLGNKHLVGM